VRQALVTGATGLVGSEFLRRLVAWAPDVQPILMVRDKPRLTAAARVDALCRELFGTDAAAVRPAMRVVSGDLATDRFGLDDETYDDLAASVTEIWHLAADVRFDLPLEVARRVHVEGTAQLAALARQAVAYGQFTRFHHVSTYAAARRDGASRIREEAPVPGSQFRNTYEQTKSEAEAVLLEDAGSMPVTIHRIGMVVGDSRTGWTPKFDVFYFPFRLLIDELDVALARLRIPVLSTARVNAIAIDDVADALFFLGQRPRKRGLEILHLVPGPRAPLVSATVELGMRLYIESRGRHGLSQPPLPELMVVDDVSPAHLAEVLGHGVPPEVLNLVMQVMPYGFDSAIWETDHLVKALSGSGVELRPIDSILASIVDYPVRTSWGAVPEPRPELRTRARVA
jgi:long-chain acyl-CoA synthetase